MSNPTPMPELPLDNSFGISFDTSAIKTTGILKFVSVTLKEDTMDTNDSVYVNLCDHPLYPQLEQYVKSNLSKRRQSKGKGK
jgi:hypothetical protein